MPYAHDDGET